MVSLKKSTRAHTIEQIPYVLHLTTQSIYIAVFLAYMKRISHINSAKIMASLHNLRFRLAIGVFCVYVMCLVEGARPSNLCSCLSSVCYVCKERYFYVLFWVGVSSENLFILAGHIQKILLLYSLQWGFEYIREVSKQTENNKLRTLISYTR